MTTARLKGSLPPIQGLYPAHDRLRDVAALEAKARGYVQDVLTSRLHALGLRSWQLQLASLSSVAMCIALWIRAKTLDQDERGNAERRALFAGLWPPTLWGISQSLERHEHKPRDAGRLLSRLRA